MHGRAEALAAWASDTALTVTLSATTGFVVLILGFAFHWQATRAREADVIYETVRSRIDTALNRGRCGLWDWDLARGRVFWSHSMFAILGLKPRDALLSFGEVNALVHPDDIHLYELAAQLADAKTTLVDHAFRMRHANGNWVWLRARCELVQQAGDGGPHLIGIAVDITEQKTLVERTVEADLRLRDAIETIPEAFVVWDAQNRLVLCNSNFQELHNLPTKRSQAGASYESVVAAGRKPVVRSKVTSEGQIPGARTFEAQLDDGRWLHISERRTKDGGYVSVGTDITNIKLHEEKLMESEKRLMATVADLRHSQQKLERQAEEVADLAGKICRGEDPRRRGQPGQVKVPRQYEPRAAHAAQRHHRVLRNHGGRHVRPARAPTSIANIAPTSTKAANTCSMSSTTFSTCPRSRPDASGSIPSRSSSSRSSMTRCAWCRDARTTSGSSSPHGSAAASA